MCLGEPADSVNTGRSDSTKYPVTRNRSSFEALIITLRWRTTFLHLYSKLNCGGMMATGIFIVFNDRTKRSRRIEMHQWLSFIREKISFKFLFGKAVGNKDVEKLKQK